MSLASIYCTHHLMSKCLLKKRVYCSCNILAIFSCTASCITLAVLCDPLLTLNMSGYARGFHLKIYYKLSKGHLLCIFYSFNS